MRITIEEIHESLVNGQRRQMVEQIKKYGEYDFFSDYKNWMWENEFDTIEYCDYFTDCVISYFRIIGR